MHAPVTQEWLNCLRWDALGDTTLAALGPAEVALLFDYIRVNCGQTLFARRLQLARDPLPLPESVQTLLNEDLRHLTFRYLKSSATIANLVKHASHPVLLLKGIDLGQRVYPSISLRRMWDIDILVDHRDISVFDKNLVSLGYRAEMTPVPEVLANPMHYHTHYYPESPAIGLPIEVHWRLSQRDAGVDVAGIKARALPWPAMGKMARVMAPQDLLLYLALHMSKHDFSVTVSHVWDIGEVLRWLPADFDFPTLWQQAREWGVARALSMAFHQARLCLGIDISHVGAPALDAEMADLIPDIMLNLGRHPVHETHTGAQMTTIMARNGQWRERWHIARNILLPPRAELTARYGIDVTRSRALYYYPIHWGRIWQRKRHSIGWWIRGGHRATDRRQALKDWLKGG